jgi:hypothetical protein
MPPLAGFGDGSRRGIIRGERCSTLEVLDTEGALTENVASEEIEVVVAQLRRLTRTASLEFALRVGAVIIHHFYAGDPDLWRSRGPKTASFRRLAEHPALPLSPGALFRSVALYELCDRLNAASRWEHLGASHLRLVLGLPHPVQEKLLATANSERWTVKMLQEHATQEKAGRLARGGRRAQPPVTRSLTLVKNCLRSCKELVERMAQLSSQDLEQSMLLLDETKADLEILSRSLQAARAPDPE